MNKLKFKFPQISIMPDYQPMEITLIAFLKWLLLSVIVGLICGAAGTLFNLVLTYVTELRTNNSWLLYCLPLAGLLTVFLYEKTNPSDYGTNMVLTAIRDDEKMKARSAPLIFISTALTHLTGGSAGREGAALLIGGSLSSKLTKLFHLDEKDSRVLVMCGASACFAALFGTPITAAVFSIEMVSVGIMYFSAIVPTTIAALVGASLSRYMGIAPTAFTLSVIPEDTLFNYAIVIVIGFLIAIMSIAFCYSIHKTSHIMADLFKNKYLRIVAGALIIIGLTLLSGTYDYNGAGGNIIAKAISGETKSFAFLFKLIFTAITLGCGFNGGEIVPVFFIGSTFGCLLGQILGIDPGFSAALGMVALFCGVTNCPISSLLLAIEVFGIDGLWFFALCCAISFMLSGNYSLYSEQHIVYSKVKAKYINKEAN